MKKFSNISGEKVSVEPKVENKDLMPIEILKERLLTLMDELLTVRSYGSARAELLNNSLSISGKEDLANAILDLVGDQNLRVKIDAMESLRNNSRDQLILDKKINEYSQKIENKKVLSKNSSTVSKIVRFVDNNSSNWDFDLISERFVERVQDYKSALNSAEIVKRILSDDEYNYLDKEKLALLGEYYTQRAKNLKS